MTGLHAGFLAPAGCWDQTLLADLLDGRLYPTGLHFDRVDGYPNTDGCCLIVPGRYWHGHESDITEAIERYTWVLAFRVSDEEDLLDPGKIDHPNIRWWVQTPHTGRDYGAARLFGVGYTPHLNDLPAEPPTKDVPVFLAAQNTHKRRRQCFTHTRLITGAEVIETAGFTQGIDPADYAAAMTRAKVAPCPSGPVCPDSFRVWEALQAHTVPIADDITPAYDSRGYWHTVTPGAPFPILTDYNCLPGWCGDNVRAWPAPANRITAWWMRQKRLYARWLRDDLEQLGAL